MNYIIIYYIYEKFKIKFRIKKLRYKYPKYNSFIESYIERFHGNSEELFMIYYKFTLEHNKILSKNGINLIIKIQNIFLINLEFICYRIVF